VGVVAARSKHAAMQIDEARTNETALALPWLALRNECRVSKGATGQRSAVCTRRA